MTPSNTTNVAVVHSLTYWGTGVYNLGLAVISEALRLAAHAYHTSTNPTATEVQQAVAFIQGTALDVTVQLFALGYNPERLRGGFFAQW